MIRLGRDREAAVDGAIENGRGAVEIFTEQGNPSLLRSPDINEILPGSRYQI